MRNQNQKIQNSLKAISYKLKADSGITIYLAMLVMGGALAVALSVSTLMVGEFKISGDTINSLKAIYVVDSVMEYGLYQLRPEGEYENNSDTTGVNTLTLSTDVFTADNVLQLDHNISQEVSNSIQYNNCPAGLSSDTRVGCELKINMVRKDISSLSTCSDSSAIDCTQMKIRGTFNNINHSI